MSPGQLDRQGVTPVELQRRLEAERRGADFVLYRDGAGAQVLLELPPEGRPVTIGRREGSDVTLPWDREVSRLHAQLERLGADWVLVDEGLSHNGTFVNGERVHARRRLRDGDVVTVGRTLLSFHAPSHSVASATRTASHTGPPVALTPAQRRVLVELCRPMGGGRYDAPASNRRIADTLCLSVDTVKGTMRGLFETFGLDGLPQNEKRAALATAALDRGLVRRDELVS